MEDKQAPENATHRVEITVFIEASTDKVAYEIAESIIDTMKLVPGVIEAQPNKSE